MMLNRRRTMLMNNRQEKEMKEWVELLNESRDITGEKNIEFSLSTTESHDEYWLWLDIAKHTGENAVNGQVRIHINGASIGYYMFAKDYTKDNTNTILHIYMQPVGVAEIMESSVSLKFNRTAIGGLSNVGEETGTGKFTLEFPANYTGKITAKILGR